MIHRRCANPITKLTYPVKRVGRLSFKLRQQHRVFNINYHEPRQKIIEEVVTLFEYKSMVSTLFNI